MAKTKRSSFQAPQPATTAVEVKATEPQVDITGIPTIAHRHVQTGYKYLGVDKDGIHILHDETGYHRVASDGIQLDLLGDGLPKEYLASLKK